MTLQSVPRRARMRALGASVQRERVELSTESGNKVVGYLYQAEGSTPRPGVLLVPGTNDSAAVFEGWSQPINAYEIAARGWVVMSFDPPGRGESWGEEEYGGLEQQQALLAALRILCAHRAVDPTNVGILSISLGIGMACGAVAGASDRPLSWLVDWEGPSDREVITSGQTIMTPALGHSMSDDVYWHPREAVRHVGQLGCGYWRIQAQPDHAQAEDVRHASRMVAAAAGGSLPWFKLNHHPRNEVPAHPRYFDGGRMAANRAILSVLGQLRGK